MIFNGRGGLGADVAVSSSVLFGFTSERNPQIRTIGGLGTYVNTSIGGLTLGMSTSFSRRRFERQPWSFVNVGYGIGSRTLSGGGSFGVSGTKVIPLNND